MDAVRFVIALVVASLGLGGAVACLYLVTLAIAARRHPHASDASRRPPTLRVAVVVPAHDESALIARCVASLRAQSYPECLRDVLVIADNCTDDTAARAAAAGADVLVRNDPMARGKGHALRWGMQRVLRDRPDVDAIAVVDADTIADPDWLATLVRRVEDGDASAAQGESLLLEDGTARSALRVAAFLLINRVRPAGRAALGLPCTLCGNGMLLTRLLLERHPWNALSATEDLEYSITLRRAGIRPAFARGAILRSAAAPDARAATAQQLRWEGGKLHLARRLVPRLLREALHERRIRLLDVAFELALPPFGLLTGAVVTGAGIVGAMAAAGALPAWALIPWLTALVAVPAYVLLGLWAAQAPASSYWALTRAPLLLAGKLPHLRRLAHFRAESWVRTARSSAGSDGDVES